ncbi:MAG: hypothetical protein AAF337_11475 [Pseudomonadota bacterium]
MDTQSLETAFRTAFAPLLAGEIGEKGATSAALLDFCHPKGTFVVDDLPYPLDKTGLADHRAFHDGGLWSKCTLAIVSLNIDVHKTTDGLSGVIHGTYNLRGKPTDAGFRQRPGHLSAMCVWDDTAKSWQALNIHFSPLFAQVLDASPS